VIEGGVKDMEGKEASVSRQPCNLDLGTKRWTRSLLHVWLCKESTIGLPSSRLAALPFVLTQERKKETGIRERSSTHAFRARKGVQFGSVADG
jgi:hypothetical protein